MTPTNDSPVSRVGIVSNDSKLKTALASVLSREFAIVDLWPTGAESWISPGDPVDALMLDIDSFIGRSGTLQSVFDNLADSGAPIVILASDESRLEAARLAERVHGCVRKPPVLRELRSVLRSALTSGRLARDLASARRQLEGVNGLDQLVGSSSPMQLVYSLIRKVANLDASVLITGESGTGKELICQAIHCLGKRADRPFVAVSCSAIPETLIEAELFGHEKGAFTGTTGTREGYFEQAGGGTLFLDEIGDLNLHTQVKLLRVLQQREFSRLGSNRLIPLRARIVCATHRDLGTMVARGTFRQDLYYRINVVNINAPALRDIVTDIPSLAHHCLMKYSESYGKAVENIEPRAMAYLQSYPWPGNCRELENVIQRALVVAEGHSIAPTDLPEFIQDLPLSNESDILPSGSFERLVRDYKIRIVVEAIQHCNGSKTLASQRLSITRAYLHRLFRLSPTAMPDDKVTEIRDSGLRAAAG